MAFFQDFAHSSTGPFDVEEIQGLVTNYIARDGDELQQLQSERRPGRPASNREDFLKQRNAVEKGEYTSGFWVPDMRDAKNLEKLRGWKGEWSALGTIQWVRVDGDGRVHASRFPPKGQS